MAKPSSGSNGRIGEMEIGPISKHGKDLGEAAMVAARAFHNDPFFEFLEPRPVVRARGLPLFWRSVISGTGPTAQLTAARQPDGYMAAVSVVVPPGGYPPPIIGQVRTTAGAFRAMVTRPPALRDGIRYLVSMEKAHPKDEVWYLLLLVVDPSIQRAGLGTLLQQKMLEAADRDGLDCYLETQKADNVPYYRRFGYEVSRELKPVPGGPPLWSMRRPPA